MAVASFAILISFCLANMCLGASVPAQPTTDPPDWINNPSLSNTGNFSVSWDASTSPSPTYTLEADTDQNFGSPTQVYSGTATQFACTGFANGCWYIRVLASSTLPTSTANADHPTWVDTTIPTPPAPPATVTGLTVPAQSGPAFTVSWTRLSGSIYYQVQQEYLIAFPLSPVPTGYSPTPVISTIYDGANNACLVSPVTCDGDWYRFRLRAYTLFQGYRVYGAWCTWSPQVDVANAMPGPPWSVGATGSTSGGTVTITVGNAQGASSYEFKEDIDANFSNPVQVYPAPGGGPVPTGASAFTLGGKTDGIYFYMVRALNTYGASPWVRSTVGAVVTGNPPAVPPATPSSMTVQASSFNGWFWVSWTGVSGATSYELQEDVTSAFSSPVDVSPANPQTQVQFYRPTDGTYYYRVRAVNAAGPSAWCVGPNPCVVAISSAACSVARHGAAPLFKDILPGDTGQLVLAFTVSADTAADTRIETVAVTSTGTGDEVSDITQITLYRDADANGVWTQGTDTVLSGPAGFPTDDGTVSFNALSRTLTAGVSETWFVVADFSGSASGGDDFLFSLAGYSGSLTAVHDATGNAMNVVGLPVTGTRVTVYAATIPGILFIAKAANSPADTVGTAGDFGVVMGAATVTAGNVEAVDLLTISVRASGTGDDASEVAGVFLAEDVDADGLYTMGTDRLIGTAGTFSSDDGTVVFSLAGESLPSLTSMTLLAVYDISSQAVGGSTFSVTFEAGSLAGLGVTSGQSVPVVGLPIDGRTVTIAVAPAPPPPSDDGSCARGSGRGGAWGALPLLALAFAIALFRRRGLSACKGST
ncbi:MAG: phage tail protein [Planctomycetota bacterium]|jgi:hypothetical protein